MKNFETAPKSLQDKKKTLGRREFLSLLGGAAAACGFGSACGPAEWVLPPEEAAQVDKKLSQFLALNREQFEKTDTVSLPLLQRMQQNIVRQIPDFEANLAAYKKELFARLSGLKDLIFLMIKHLSPYLPEENQIKTDKDLEVFKQKVEVAWENFLNEWQTNFDKYFQSVFIWSGAVFDRTKINEIMDNIMKKDFSDSTVADQFIHDPEMQIMSIRSIFFNYTETANPEKNFFLPAANYLLTRSLLPSLCQDYTGKIFAAAIASQTTLENVSPGYFEPAADKKYLFSIPYASFNKLPFCLLGKKTLSAEQIYETVKSANVPRLREYFLDKDLDYEKYGRNIKTVYEKILGGDQSINEYFRDRGYSNSAYSPAEGDFIALFSELFDRQSQAQKGTKMPISSDINKVL